MGATPPLEGRRFGRLTVIERTAARRFDKVVWRCRCDCGGEVTTTTGSLMNGDRRSCGCYRTKYSTPAAKLEAKRAGWRRYWNTVGAEPRRWASFVVRRARRRAARLGVPFDLQVEDLLPLAEICPIFGVALDYSTGTKGSGPRSNSPALDRYDNALGYVKGNVWIISHRANSLKNNATLEELEMLVSLLQSEKKRRARRAFRTA